MTDSAWLSQLVAEELERYGLDAPAVAPTLWPEVGGRGVILADPRESHLANAHTIRLMAPGISAAMSDGYMRYTDASGGYVNYRTGAARFTDGIPRVLTSGSPMSRAEGQRFWAWPTAAVGHASLRVDSVLDRGVQDVVCDEMGWRIVIDAGDLPEPSFYLDLDRPERASRSGWWPAQPRHGTELVGSAITAFTVEETAVELEASNGSRLRCSVDPDYETWQLVRVGQAVWVGLPGGGFATFENTAGCRGDASLLNG